MLRFLFICCIASALIGCATMKNTIDRSDLQQGKRLFDSGYYRRAMRILMPLAAKGIPQAEYAVGYMFYYGYGVSRDPELGFTWIDRAAAAQYPPAITAHEMMLQNREEEKREEEHFQAQSERMKGEGIGARI